jgi:hypothetical protein
VELSADRIALDDRQARREARRLGLRVAGSVGIALEAQRLGLLVEVQAILDAMREVGFHLGQAVYEEALSIAARQRGQGNQP